MRNAHALRMIGASILALSCARCLDRPQPELAEGDPAAKSSAVGEASEPDPGGDAAFAPIWAPDPDRLQAASGEELRELEVMRERLKDRIPTRSEVGVPAYPGAGACSVDPPRPDAGSDHSRPFTRPASMTLALVRLLSSDPKSEIVAFYDARLGRGELEGWRKDTISGTDIVVFWKGEGEPSPERLSLAPFVSVSEAVQGRDMVSYLADMRSTIYYSVPSATPVEVLTTQREGAPPAARVDDEAPPIDRQLHLPTGLIGSMLPTGTEPARSLERDPLRHVFLSWERGDELHLVHAASFNDLQPLTCRRSAESLECQDGVRLRVHQEIAPPEPDPQLFADWTYSTRVLELDRPLFLPREEDTLIGEASQEAYERVQALAETGDRGALLAFVEDLPAIEESPQWRGLLDDAVKRREPALAAALFARLGLPSGRGSRDPAPALAALIYGDACLALGDASCFTNLVMRVSADALPRDVWSSAALRGSRPPIERLTEAGIDVERFLRGLCLVYRSTPGRSIELSTAHLAAAINRSEHSRGLVRFLERLAVHPSVDAANRLRALETLLALRAVQDEAGAGAPAAMHDPDSLGEGDLRALQRFDEHLDSLESLAFDASSRIWLEQHRALVVWEKVRMSSSERSIDSEAFEELLQGAEDGSIADALSRTRQDIMARSIEAMEERLEADPDDVVLRRAWELAEQDRGEGAF